MHRLFLLAIMLVGVSAVPGPHFGHGAFVVCAQTAAESPAAAPLRRETLVLRGGQSLRGDLLREKADTLVMDLGFTVLTVPTDLIERRLANEDDAGAAQARTARDAIFREAAPGQLPERTVKDLAADLGESVVLVSTPAGMGSGFIIDPKGYVVTNFHVIAGEQEISITLFRREGTVLDRVKVEKVRILALNPLLDLALLSMTPPASGALKPVFLGADGAAADGQPVFAIGNPLGLERTVSEGILSNTRRTFDGQIFLQTTAPINPGNSGGPLFNLRGEVIGVTNMKAGYLTEGLGFAVPVDTLKRFLRNRDVFAFDKDNPNSGYRYLPPPRKSVSRTPPEAP